MSLLTVLLWCLHPLAPARRLYELTRHTLQLTIRQLSDQRTIDWLCDDPDNPRTFARFETWIANLSAGVDTLIYLRARELLGLPNHDWARPLEAPPQRRKSRSFAELWLSLERCILKFGDIERLAARRAVKLKRLLPEWSGATTEQQQSHSPHEALILRTHPAKPCAWTRRSSRRRRRRDLVQWTKSRSGRPGRGKAQQAEAVRVMISMISMIVMIAVIAVIARPRAGLRVRAPPWPHATPYSPLPIPSKRQLPRPRPHARKPRTPPHGAENASQQPQLPIVPPSFHR